ncbi:outer membrane beta-barrel protein [Capnocytophaga stomatis]|uniref:outer membrane beta-barrel protein n=1 Tax=Capnocytophaga stomatis TaxID=1848904 RepID=UPI001952137F|nr:outer membrane beta-barrel protein [Capnocytophaga stomatis]
MKKLLCLLSFFMVTCVFSQSVTPRFGLNVDQASYSSKVDTYPGITYNYRWAFPTYQFDFERLDYGNGKSYKIGYHIGANVEFPIFRFLDVESGVFYITRGESIKGNARESNSEVIRGTYTDRTNIHTIYTPLNLKFNVRVYNDLYFNVLVGGYMDVFLSGKRKFSIRSYSEETEIPFGNDGYKRYGFSPTLGAGITYKPFVFRFTFDGWTNYASEAKTISTSSFTFSVGYKFDLRRK